MWFGNHVRLIVGCQWVGNFVELFVGVAVLVVNDENVTSVSVGK